MRVNLTGQMTVHAAAVHVGNPTSLWHSHCVWCNTYCHDREEAVVKDWLAEHQLRFCPTLLKSARTGEAP